MSKARNGVICILRGLGRSNSPSSLIASEADGDCGEKSFVLDIDSALASITYLQSNIGRLSKGVFMISGFKITTNPPLRSGMRKQDQVRFWSRYTNPFIPRANLITTPTTYPTSSSPRYSLSLRKFARARVKTSWKASFFGRVCRSRSPRVHHNHIISTSHVHLRPYR